MSPTYFSKNYQHQPPFLGGHLSVTEAERHLSWRTSPIQHTNCSPSFPQAESCTASILEKQSESTATSHRLWGLWTCRFTSPWFMFLNAQFLNLFYSMFCVFYFIIGFMLIIYLFTSIYYLLLFCFTYYIAKAYIWYSDVPGWWILFLNVFNTFEWQYTELNYKLSNSK